MRLSALLSIGTLTTMACAECFGGSDPKDRWGDRTIGSILIAHACKGTLAKTYNGNEQVHATLWNEWHTEAFSFQINRIKDSSRTLTYAECLSGLDKELRCEYGGSSTYRNWQYTAKPGSTIG
ncbi:hypothetical protein F4821DRAFT_276201 [Hypoxylon rubiginosum]|uniref:Uncharacterized protein n=1 Tax=Hypoxylon rubiginosum TaxID=110542 RepID=A0ACC0CJ33_9PEZI|nr:hypothetical protein F4821DRAFT_276201 [Hypoxylon rubiginosum]